MKEDGPSIWTRSALARQLRALGVREGGILMVHAGLRAIGRVLGGPDAVIGALRDTVGPQGTLLAYTDWNGADDNIWDDDGRVPTELKPEIAPFDPAASRATRYNGAFVEFVRTTPGARRSASPGASCAAIGPDADWLLAPHALDYGYGEDSPFARLVAAGGQVLMLGAPLDTMTLLHHAEHLADIPGKRVIRYETPVLEHGRAVWRWFEEFDTSDPVVDGFAEDYFATIVEAFLGGGGGTRGTIGRAPSVLVDAAAIVPFAVRWMEAGAPRPA